MQVHSPIHVQVQAAAYQVDVDCCKHIFIWLDAVLATSHHQLYIKHYVAGKYSCSDARDGYVDHLGMEEDG